MADMADMADMAILREEQLQQPRCSQDLLRLHSPVRRSKSLASPKMSKSHKSKDAKVPK